MTDGSISILARPVYGILEAAGLLGLRADRVWVWLDGYKREASQYPPVIRVEPTGGDIVTWGEFVELGYLREYRRAGVPLQRLRPVIDDLRREFDTPYPLAIAKPYVVGKELVLELQERNGLPAAIAIGDPIRPAVAAGAGRAPLRQEGRVRPARAGRSGRPEAQEER